jgi:hypothetical protein
VLWLPVFVSRHILIRTFFGGSAKSSVANSSRVFRSGKIYSILILAMTKRKPSRFSATKAVKANARDRIGQPKPARVVDTEPRSGREAKHKPKLDQIIQQED